MIRSIRTYLDDDINGSDRTRWYHGTPERMAQVDEPIVTDAAMSQENVAPKKRRFRHFPTTADQWLDEILRAWNDAAHTKPIGPLAGTIMSDRELFHLAPIICLKFRGREQTGPEADRVIREALASHVMKTDPAATGSHVVSSKPKMVFAQCYMAAHLALDLVDEQTVNQVLAYCEERLVG
jgi:hypothetical protein